MLIPGVSTSYWVDRAAKVGESFVATWSERQRYENNWKLALNVQGPIAPMSERRLLRSCQSYQNFFDKKMSKIKIIQLYRAIKLAEDRLEKRNGNGVPGPSHLCPRRHGQDRNPALKSVHELNSSYKSVACKVCAKIMLCIAIFALAMVFTLPASQRQQKRTIWLVRSGSLFDILCAPATRGSTRIQWSLSSQLLVLVRSGWTHDDRWIRSRAMETHFKYGVHHFSSGSVRRSAFQALASAVKPTGEVSGSNALHGWSCPFDLYCDDEVASGPG